VFDGSSLFGVELVEISNGHRSRISGVQDPALDQFLLLFATS
jgi:hypothetical protein